MTAINSIVVGRTGYIVSDTSYVDESGVVRFFSNKVKVHPHNKTAVGIRGTLETARIIADEVDVLSSFDDVLELLPDRLECMNREDQFVGIETYFEVIVLGWSDIRDRPETYILSSRGDDKFKFVNNEIIVAPTPCLENITRAAALANPLSDPQGFLLRIINDQRSEPYVFMSDDDSNNTFTIGGKAIMTTLDESGFNQSIAEDWGDKLDEAICGDRGSLSGAVSGIGSGLGIGAALLPATMMAGPAGWIAAAIGPVVGPAIQGGSRDKSDKKEASK